MKTIVLATAVGAFIALTGSANATQFVSDPLLKDFASTGQVVNPHGFAGGR